MLRKELFKSHLGYNSSAICCIRRLHRRYEYFWKYREDWKVKSTSTVSAQCRCVVLINCKIVA